MILAGDVGGTKTVLALFENIDGGPRQHGDATFRSEDQDSLEQVIARFLDDHPGVRVDVACLGVAGPVIGGRAEMTNLTWKPLSEAQLARASGARRVKLLNDLEAAAYGILALADDELVVLHGGAGPEREGNAAVIAAGTGLGEAILFWDGERHRAIATEGGHADFSPRTEREIALLEFLRADLGGRVSIERVLSGPGLHNIYRFLRARGDAPEPAWLTERMRRGDPSAVIGEAGLAGSDPVCVESLDLFTSVYGAKAGDLALQCVAVGGVFVGGGIAPKILPALRKGAFMEAFTDKGRFAKLVLGIRVSVAINPRAPLLGAARFASQL